MNMSMCFIVFILAFGVSYVANSMLDVGDKINGLTPRTTGTQRVAAEVAYPPYSIYFTIVGWIMPALYCLWFYFFGSSSMPQESNDDEASSPPDKQSISRDDNLNSDHTTNSRTSGKISKRTSAAAGGHNNNNRTKPSPPPSPVKYRNANAHYFYENRYNNNENDKDYYNNNNNININNNNSHHQNNNYNGNKKNRGPSSFKNAKTQTSATSGGGGGGKASAPLPEVPKHGITVTAPLPEVPKNKEPVASSQESPKSKVSAAISIPESPKNRMTAAVSTPESPKNRMTAAISIPESPKNRMTAAVVSSPESPKSNVPTTTASVSNVPKNRAAAIAASSPSSPSNLHSEAPKNNKVTVVSPPPSPYPVTRKTEVSKTTETNKPSSGQQVVQPVSLKTVDEPSPPTVDGMNSCKNSNKEKKTANKTAVDALPAIKKTSEQQQAVVINKQQPKKENEKPDVERNNVVAAIANDGGSPNSKRNKRRRKQAAANRQQQQAIAVIVEVVADNNRLADAVDTSPPTDQLLKRVTNTATTTTDNTTATTTTDNTTATTTTTDNTTVTTTTDNTITATTTDNTITTTTTDNTITTTTTDNTTVTTTTNNNTTATTITNNNDTNTNTKTNIATTTDSSITTANTTTRSRDNSSATSNDSNNNTTLADKKASPATGKVEIQSWKLTNAVVVANVRDTFESSERANLKMTDQYIWSLLTNYVMSINEMYMDGFPFPSVLLNHAVFYRTNVPQKKLNPVAKEFSLAASKTPPVSANSSQCDRRGGGCGRKSNGSTTSDEQQKQRQQTPKNTVTCVRCSSFFSMDYTRPDPCLYHYGKIVYGHNTPGLYSCCKNGPTSRGCTKVEHHVWNGFVDGQQNGPFSGFEKTYRKSEGYKVHTTNPLDDNVPAFIVTPAPTSRTTAKTTGQKRVYGLDCEMCYTKLGLEVTKITLVDVRGTVVYDTLVLPTNRIVDYNTRFSGITAEQLAKGPTKRLDAVQRDLLGYINDDTILVGHGLGIDLFVLRMFHFRVVDTSVLFPHPYGKPYKLSLKALAAKLLKRDIQNEEEGHDSKEDARATMDLALYKLRRDVEDDHHPSWNQNYYYRCQQEYQQQLQQQYLNERRLFANDYKDSGDGGGSCYLTATAIVMAAAVTRETKHALTTVNVAAAVANSTTARL